MAIYELNTSGLKRLERTTFADKGIRERQDIQRLLREQIEIISDQTLVIAEEFGEWDESRRRIDLLCIDKQANLVVIELKRSEDGGHMDLQAIRYSAMISTMTFEQVVDAHGRYLSSVGSDDDPRQNILDFLDWDEPDEDEFAQDVRIILASAEFSKELTSSVLWLNEKGLDIRCVKMEPFHDGERIFLDVQQVIPLPEAEQFQIKVRQKKQKEQQARASSRDFSKFTLRVSGNEYRNLSKRHLMYQLAKSVVESGRTPEDLANIISWRKNQLFKRFDGELDEQQFSEKLMEFDGGGQVPKTKRYFCQNDELFIIDGYTYALTNQWGVKTLDAVQLIQESYPDLRVELERC